MENKGFALRPIEQVHSIDNAREWCGQLEREQNRPLLIVEDGGFLTPAILGNSELVSRVVGTVEQTTRGLRNIENAIANAAHRDITGHLPAPFPIISLPDSKFKQKVEAPHIADAAVRAVQNMLVNHTLRGKTAAVIGCGTIGNELIRVLQDLGVAVCAWDKDTTAMIDARQRGTSTFTTPVEAVSNAQFVFGTSGYGSITREIIDNVRHDAWLISTSSGRNEIGLEHLEKEAERKECHMSMDHGEHTKFNAKIGVKYTYANGKIVNVLASGAPVNFREFGQMSNEAAGPIMTLIFLAATELAAGSFQNKKWLLRDAAQSLVVKYALDKAYLDALQPRQSAPP